MKRLLTIVFILVIVSAIACFFQVRSCLCKPPVEVEFPEQGESALEKIDSRLSAVHTKFLDRKNENNIRNFQEWLNSIDRTEKVSQTEISEVKRMLFNADKKSAPSSEMRILKFEGESPTPTDILLLLAQQCNYYKCPNVCIEDDDYFYAWLEGDFHHGTLVDKKNLSVRSWNFKDGACALFRQRDK